MGMNEELSSMNERSEKEHVDLTDDERREKKSKFEEKRNQFLKKKSRYYKGSSEPKNFST